MKLRLFALLTLALAVAAVPPGLAETDGDWTYTVSDGKAAITGYSGNETNLVVPDTLGGCPVTEIGSEALRDHYSFVTVTLPETVTSIGGYAFFGCRNLQTIRLPSGLTSLGRSAFYSCSSMREIVLPDSLTTIGSFVFSNCSSLASVRLPVNLTSIPEYTFNGCTALTGIDFPPTVTHIGERAFAGSGFQPSTVPSIPEGITNVGSYAFDRCLNLRSFTFPESVTSISNGPFLSCTSLREVHLPSGLTRIPEKLVDGCTALEELTIPEDVKSIGSEAFQNCTSLTCLHLPDGLTSIGNNAFRRSGLTTLTIPEGVRTIPQGMADGASSLASVVIPESVTTISTANNSNPFPYSAILYVYPGSPAESWAEEKRRHFISLDGFNYEQEVTLTCISEASLDIDEAWNWRRQLHLSLELQEHPLTFSAESSNPEVGTVEGNRIRLLKEGAFTLTIRCEPLTKLNRTIAVTVSPAVESFFVPSNFYVKEGTFDENPLKPANVVPPDANPVFTFDLILPGGSQIRTAGEEYFLPEEYRNMKRGVWVTSHSGISMSTTIVPWTYIDGFAIQNGGNAVLPAYVGDIVSLMLSFNLDGYRFNERTPATIAALSSDHPEILRVTADGRLIALSPGDATVTATVVDGSASASQKFRVVKGAGTASVLPENLTDIRGSAFEKNRLQSLVIPASCRSVGSRAFANCADLRLLLFEGSPASVASDAFEGCGSLTIIAPKGSDELKAAAENQNVEYIER